MTPYVFDCELEKEIVVTTTIEAWLEDNTYEYKDSTFFKNKLSNSEVEFKIFANYTSTRFAIWFSASSPNAKPLLWVNIHNLTYLWAFLEMGIQSLLGSMIPNNAYAIYTSKERGNEQ